MAETVGFLIVEAIATTGAAEGLVAFAEASYLGISGATVIGSAAILGATIGLAYATTRPPDLPRPENGSQPLKQSVPPRIKAYGTVRLAGYYMFFEAAGAPPSLSYDVMALHSGRISQYQRYFLHDDEINTSSDVTLGGYSGVVGSYADGRYASAITIETSLGTDDQFAAASFAGDSNISSFYTADHRGRGTAWVAMKCVGPSDPTAYARVYPHNLPLFSAVVDASPVFDPREPSHSRSDPTTWQFSRNPVLQLMDYLTASDGGLGEDYDTLIAPQLERWIEAADLCDEEVATSTSSEPRYRCDGWFRFDNSPDDVIGSFLSTCDGWLSEAGDGSLGITVGFYVTPDDPPLTEDHITGLDLAYGAGDEETVNQLDITFTNPDRFYVEEQLDPWRDEDAIALTGVVRARQLKLPWVQSPTQARRLAGRAMERLNPLMSGSFTTTLYGLRYLGKRWVPIQYPYVSGLQDCVVEIQGAEIDLMADRITWKFIRVRPDFIEAYDPLTDEGGIPGVLPPGPGVERALLREDLTFLLREDGTNYQREGF